MRLKLDLSEFFEDRRKFSMVNLPCEDKATVGDVLRKIIKLFKVGDVVGEGASNLGLFEEEFYIPPEETSTVLQDIKVVKVKSLPNVQELPSNDRKKKRRKRSIDSEVQSTDAERERGGKKRKIYEDELQSDIERSERRVRKGRSEVLEDNRLSDCERKSKRSKRSADHVSEVLSDVDEQVVRQVVRESRRRGRESEGFEMGKGKDKRKPKKGSITTQRYDSDSRTEIPPGKEKKKRKKSCDPQISDDDSVEELQEKEEKRKRKGKSKEMTGQKMRGNTRILDDAEEDSISQVELQKKKSKAYEKNFRQKASTSTVINLESDDGSSDEADSLSNESSDESDILESKPPNEDFNPLRRTGGKTRRKRRHNRKGKQLKNQAVNNAVPLYPTAFDNDERHILSLSNETMHQNYNIPYTRPRNKRPPNEVGVIQKKHIIFNSEDEEEEIAGFYEPFPGEAAHEIEIVDSKSRTRKRNGSDCTQGHLSQEGDSLDVGSRLHKAKSDPHEISNILFGKQDRVTRMSPADMRGRYIHSTPVVRNSPLVPPVVEVETEPPSTPLLPPEHPRTRNVLNRRQVLGKTDGSTDDLATFRRICENKTITIVKIDSAKDKAKPNIRDSPQKADMMPNLGPPQSPISNVSKEITEENAQTFHNLLTIKNRKSPLVIPKAKPVIQGPRSKDVYGVFGSHDEVHAYQATHQSGKGRPYEPFQCSQNPLEAQDGIITVGAANQCDKRQNNQTSESWQYSDNFRNDAMEILLANTSKSNSTSTENKTQNSPSKSRTETSASEILIASTSKYPTIPTSKRLSSTPSSSKTETKASEILMASMSKSPKTTPKTDPNEKSVNSSHSKNFDEEVLPVTVKPNLSTNEKLSNSSNSEANEIRREESISNTSASPNVSTSISNQNFSTSKVTEAVGDILMANVSSCVDITTEEKQQNTPTPTNIRNQNFSPGKKNEALGDILITDVTSCGDISVEEKKQNTPQSLSNDTLREILKSFSSKSPNVSSSEKGQNCHPNVSIEDDSEVQMSSALSSSPPGADTRNQRSGSVPSSRKRDTPRGFQGIGAILSNLKSPVDSGIDMCDSRHIRDEDVHDDSDQLQPGTTANVAKMYMGMDVSSSHISPSSENEAAGSSPQGVHEMPVLLKKPRIPPENYDDDDDDDDDIIVDLDSDEEDSGSHMPNSTPHAVDEEVLDEEMEEELDEEDFMEDGSPLSPEYEEDDTEDNVEEEEDEDEEEEERVRNQRNSQKTTNEVSKKSEEDIDQFFEEFPLLTAIPKAGEAIALKTLSVDDKMCPIPSRYLQAHVLEVSGLKLKLKYDDVLNISKSSKNNKNEDEDVEEVDLTFEEDDSDTVRDTRERLGVIEELDWRDIQEPRRLLSLPCDIVASEASTQSSTSQAREGKLEAT